MEDPVLECTGHLRAWRVRLAEGAAPDFMREILERAQREGAEVLVLDGELVFGIDHLRAALYHARRAMAEGSNSSQSLAMETLLYASGERQLSTAIEKMSVDEGTTEVVVAQLSEQPVRAEDFWMPLLEESGFPVERLLRFGLTPVELSTVSGRRPEELVLEKVAAVDVMKR